MAEIRLIVTNDFAQYKQILATVNAERLEPYIMEAQRLDIKPFLGEELYHDFVENVDTTNYKKLLSGGDYTYGNYTYYFNGIKPALVYFAYSRFLQNQGVTVTGFGVVQKKTEFSDQVDNDTLSRLVTSAREVGYAYLREVETFLDRNTATYTLWGYSTTRPHHGIRITPVAPDLEYNELTNKMISTNSGTDLEIESCDA